MNPLHFLQLVNERIQQNGNKVPDELLQAIQQQPTRPLKNLTNQEEKRIINQTVKKALWAR